MNVFDVPCGFGRIAFHLAKRMNGIEFNKYLVDYAKAGRGKRIEDKPYRGRYERFFFRKKIRRALLVRQLGISDEDNERFINLLRGA